jgi:transposase-like protein
MQTIETTRRTYRTKFQKIELLNELQSGGMTVSTLARKHGIHPVTIHKWKRDMSQETKKDSIDVHEILQELEKLKVENNHLKKAVGNLAITNEILKTANDVLKKNQRSEKLKSPKK